MWKRTFAGLLTLVFTLSYYFSPYKLVLVTEDQEILFSGTYAQTPEWEKSRVQNRLKLIEELLRAKDVSYLPPHLRMARAKNLDVLNTYWQKGNFPKNTNRPGERVPFFIDAYGTPCAVGHLMIKSGYGKTAREIAKQDNTIYADQIRLPEFTAWAETSGLTPEELFLIQPTYNFPEPTAPPIRRGPISQIGTRQVRLPSGSVCFDSSPTFLMRDTSSSCGATTTFCTTPLSCYSPNSGQYLGGAVVTCRAGGSDLSCPGLQACADDVRQEFITENQYSKWLPTDAPVAICQAFGCRTPSASEVTHK